MVIVIIFYVRQGFIDSMEDGKKGILISTVRAHRKLLQKKLLTIFFHQGDVENFSESLNFLSIPKQFYYFATSTVAIIELNQMIFICLLIIALENHSSS